jgi:hypothetical protein
MISLLLLIPIIGSILLLPIKENSNQLKMKQIALTTSLINFFISLFMWYQFDSNITQYQFVTEFNHLNLYHLNFGIDSISLYFVLLTTFVTPVALLSNYTNITNNLKTFLISFLILESLQICAFVSLDLLLFYIFFESVLPVLFIVIVIFGHGQDKYRSALLFFLYTLAGSLPMLLSILTIYNYIGSTDFQLLSLYEINIDYQKVLWLSLPFSKDEMTSRYLNKNYSNISGKFIIAKKMKWLPENKDCKSLVVYGSNLSSTVNYTYYNRIVRHMVQIPKNLDSLILGIILSDGHLFKNKAGNTLLSFKQTIKRFDFLWLIFLKFSHFCQGYPRLDFSRLNGKYYCLIYFATRVYPCFTEWHNMFYVNNKKIVPLDLYNMLDYEALAYWIMCDGTKVGTGITLQTQSFTVKECVFIVSILIHKFDLKCNIYMQRNQPTIYMNSKSIKKIKYNLLPYFPISMRYKFKL